MGYASRNLPYVSAPDNQTLCPLLTVLGKNHDTFALFSGIPNQSLAHIFLFIQCGPAMSDGRGIDPRVVYTREKQSDVEQAWTAICV